MTLKRKLREGLRLEKLSEKYDKESKALKHKIWNELEFKYAVVLNREVKENFSWKNNLFEGKIRMLFRSLVRRNTIVRISSERLSEGFFLTQKYGLKTPRTQRSYNFIPWSIDQTEMNLPSFKDGHWRDSRRHIPFIELKDIKAIDSRKLKKLFYFLKEILKLAKAFQRIENEFEKGFKNIEELKDLKDWSRLKDFSDFMKNESMLDKCYKIYQTKLWDFKVKQEKLVKELKEYNKPFRVLLTLKEGKEDEY